MASEFEGEWGSNLGTPSQNEGNLRITDLNNGNVVVQHFENGAPTLEDGSGRIFLNETPQRIVIQRIRRNGVIMIYHGTLDLNPQPPPPDIRKRINGRFIRITLGVDLTGALQFNVAPPDDWTGNIPPPPPPDEGKLIDRDQASNKSKK